MKLEVNRKQRKVHTMLAIAAGAIPGAVGRFYVGELSKAVWHQPYFGTIAVNLVGSLIIAWVITANEERFRHWAPEVRLALVTGFCGAFTTFSTYGWETTLLLNQGRAVAAIAYCLGSAIAGLGGVGLGVGLARWGMHQE